MIGGISDFEPKVIARSVVGSVSAEVGSAVAVFAFTKTSAVSLAEAFAETFAETFHGVLAVALALAFVALAEAARETSAIIQIASAVTCGHSINRWAGLSLRRVGLLKLDHAP